MRFKDVMKFVEIECKMPSLVHGAEVVFDTSALKHLPVVRDVGYFLEERRYRPVMVGNVLRELGDQMDKNPEVFRPEIMDRLAESGMVLEKHDLTETDKEQIAWASAVSKRGKKKTRTVSNQENPNDIGGVDKDQIGYIMKRASEGENVLVFSDDGDINQVIGALRRRMPELRDRMKVVSLRRYRNYAKTAKDSEIDYAIA